jgi:hypothetical protein
VENITWKQVCGVKTSRTVTQRFAAQCSELDTVEAYILQHAVDEGDSEPFTLRGVVIHGTTIQTPYQHCFGTETTKTYSNRPVNQVCLRVYRYSFTTFTGLEASECA